MPSYTKDDVSAFRMVGGDRVRLSDDERQAIANEWNANEAAAELKRTKREAEAKRAAALRVLEDQRLAEAMKDPNAPQPVKDYAATLTTSTR